MKFVPKLFCTVIIFWHLLLRVSASGSDCVLVSTCGAGLLRICRAMTARCRPKLTAKFPICHSQSDNLLILHSMQKIKSSVFTATDAL